MQDQRLLLTCSPPPCSLLQASLKKFMDYIQTSSVDKMLKFLEKGLDPNYQDADTGGESLTPPTGPPWAWF